MSESNAYTIIVSFISLIIIFSVVMLIVQEDKSEKASLSNTSNNSTNVTYSKLGFIMKIRCMNCIQYPESTDKQDCINLCVRYK